MIREEQTKQNKESILLDAKISDVFVVQNSKVRAYIEQFKHKGINFTQKKLGTFLGFFIVRDSSASSANIVNFLTAEIKKEYFAFPKRGMTESFEASLHRVNRALAEVANIGNVDWLGTIDGAVCAIDETKMYFSVTGNARVLLIRNESIINISEGIASEEAKQHPLKTFVDISSGQLMVGDKIIITSPELLDLISFDDLQRNALRLSRSNFVQFINTVLTNECKIATTSIIDINEKNITKTDFSKNNVKEKMGEESLEEMSIPSNVFSAQVFEDEIEKNEVNLEEAKQGENLNEDEFKEKEEYVDKRTGHIYLQGDEDVEDTNQLWSSIADFLKDKNRIVKDFVKKKFRRSKKKVEKLIDSSSKPESFIQVNSVKLADVDYEIAKLKEEIGINEKSKKIKQEKVENNKSDKDRKVNKNINKLREKNSIDLVKKYYDSNSKLDFVDEENISSIDKILDFLEFVIDLIISFVIKIYQSVLSMFKQFFSKAEKSETISKKATILKKEGLFYDRLKVFWKNVSGKNKIIWLTVLALCLATPLFFINKGDEGVNVSIIGDASDLNDSKMDNLVESDEESNVQDSVPTAVASIESEAEGNINDPREIYKGTALIYVNKIDNYDIAVTKDSIIVLDDDNIKHSLPVDSGIIKYATVMDDLKLVFLLTDKNKLFSFSPKSKEFKSQELNVDVKSVKDIETYMTYLYVVTDNGITRHARKEGGFDDGSDWIEDGTDIKSVTDVAINNNIFVIKGKNVLSFFKHKKVDFGLKDVESIDLIYIEENMKYLWALNKEKSTIYKFDKSTGKLIDEFVHGDIKNVVSFAVDEKSNIAIVTTDQIVFRFELKKK